GWELVGDWLQDAVNANNWPLAGQVLSLLDSSPMTITRLKRYNTPKLIKELSKDCKSSEVQSLAKHILVKWMEIVRENDNIGSTTGTGIPNSVSNNDSSASSLVNNIDSEPCEQPEGTDSESQRHLGNANVSNAPGNTDSSQEGGDGSSSLEGQDDSSNASTESDVSSAPMTPIRITIRSGSQVLAKVSSQRYSLDSNDSDDNKPLSVLKKEVQKSKTKTPKAPVAMSAFNVACKEKYIPPAPEVVSPEKHTSDAVAEPSTACSVNSSDVNASHCASLACASAAVTTTTATSPILTFTTTTGSMISSSCAQETLSAVNASSEMSKIESDNDREVSSENDDQTIVASSNLGDKKEDETDSKKNKEHSSDTEKIKEKEKSRSNDSEKKEKKDKDRDKERDRDKDRDKEKRHRDDKKREKDRESSKSSKSSSSSSSKHRENRNSRDSDRSKSDKERSSNSSSSHSRSSSKDKDRDRDKDRSKSSKDKDRKSSSSSRDKSRDKVKEEKHEEKKKKEQENEDRATLEKVKPLSADGLAKIPRKVQPASFLDALGSADVEVEAKKPSVKTYKSRGFRNTGLLDEPSKPPGKKGSGISSLEKKSSAGMGAPGVKRPSPLDELVASMPDKRLKSSVSSMPISSDKPGGVKLISPKRRICIEELVFWKISKVSFITSRIGYNSHGSQERRYMDNA
ncbi:hypothetical protein SK128_011716, partial [Halocaridina rubra]